MRCFLIIFIAMVFTVHSAFAEIVAVTPSLIRAEKYLQSLSTLQARFIQTAYDGTQLIGTFYLNRPGKLRFEYDAPVEDFIVADGLFIYFYDSDLGEQTNAPIGQTLADFILRPDIEFGNKINVKNVYHEDNLLKITLNQASDPGAGSITLGFKENPMELSKWQVTDAQGYVTQIELFQVQMGIDLPKETFIYRDPNREANRSFNE